MNETELKPCPFCGANLYIFGEFVLHPGNGCILSIGIKPLNFSIRNSTWVAAWNRRTE